MATLTPHQDYVAQGIATLRQIHATREYASEEARAISALSLSLIETVMPVLAERLDCEHGKEATATVLCKALGNLLATAGAQLSCCPPHASRTAFEIGYNGGVFAQMRLAGEPTAVVVTDIEPAGHA